MSQNESVNLGPCCTFCGSQSCGSILARRDTSSCLSSWTINCTVLPSAETLKVCHLLAAFLFAFVFTLLAIFMPLSLPSRKFAKAHLVSVSSSLFYVNLLWILFLCSAIPSMHFLRRIVRRQRRKTQTGYDRWIMRSNWILRWHAFFQPTGHRPVVTYDGRTESHEQQFFVR